METIVNSKLSFNNIIYLLPGHANRALCKYIMRNDYIYKCTVGDIFMNIFNREMSGDAETIVRTPVQTYLREAKHFYNLTVFKARIETSTIDNSYIKLNIHNNFCLLYGGVHIIAEENVNLITENGTLTFKNNNQKMYIDIINIYNDGSEIEKNTGLNKRINNIEKYLVYPYTDRFQIFVSATKDNPNCYIENENQYFQKYVGNLINFDVKSMYYEAKKIILISKFTLIPTFFENIEIKNCSYLELNFDKEEKDPFIDDNDINEENNENEETEESKIIDKVLEEDKTTSLNIKISTFIDLNGEEN